MDALADSYVNFTEWKTNSGQDVNSTFGGTALGAGETQVLHYNDTKSAKTYNVTGTNVRNLSGASISQITLQPFTSIVLIGSNITIN